MDGRVEPFARFHKSLAQALARTRDVKTVVTAVAGAGIRIHPAKLIGEFRVFLPAIRTNQENACGRSNLPDIRSVPHVNCPVGRARIGTARIIVILSEGHNRASCRRGLSRQLSSFLRHPSAPRYVGGPASHQKRSQYDFVSHQPAALDLGRDPRRTLAEVLADFGAESEASRTPAGQ